MESKTPLLTGLYVVFLLVVVVNTALNIKEHVEKRKDRKNKCRNCGQSI